MDVLTEETLRTRSGANPVRAPLFVAAIAYALLAGLTAAHHEPWVDEAQSWLLARDASLADLWTRLLHYEGTTGLWHTILHCLVLLGVPYWGMNVLSCVLGAGAACVLLWRAPFPLPLRLALPFTFYLAYQYAVIARSYDLLPLLLFCCAATYSKAQEKPLLFTTFLCLLAAVSVHGMILALAAGVSALVSRAPRKRLVPHLMAFTALAALLAASAWPAPDGTFVSGLNLSLNHAAEATAKAFGAAFTGEWISSLLIVALSIPFLWRGGGWIFFAFSAGLLCAIASLVYSQVWHHGVLFLAWLFSLWISAEGNPAKSGELSYKMMLAAAAIATIVQCDWTVRSAGYDWEHPYSGSLAAAQGLRGLDLHAKKLYAIGYACVGIEPYFPHNIFANLNDGRAEAYWDWSRRNHVNLDSAHLAESRPDYVIVGYKNDFERGVWTGLVRRSGYQAIRHFDGNTYWQTGIFEPESYDLFERKPPGSGTP